MELNFEMSNWQANLGSKYGNMIFGPQFGKSIWNLFFDISNHQTYYETSI